MRGSLGSAAAHGRCKSGSWFDSTWGADLVSRISVRAQGSTDHVSLRFVRRKP